LFCLNCSTTFSTGRCLCLFSVFRLVFRSPNCFFSSHLSFRRLSLDSLQILDQPISRW
jgi:hypothetical protein